MPTASVERESQEKLKATIEADDDPTSLAVTFSIVAVGERPVFPGAAGAWKPGSLVQTSDGYEAQVLSPVIGSGALDLAPERYDAYCQIEAGAEKPVLYLGRVRVR